MAKVSIKPIAGTQNRVLVSPLPLKKKKLQAELSSLTQRKKNHKKARFFPSAKLMKKETNLL